MAERSKAAVLKTVDVKASWGSNPYLPATFYHLKLLNIFRLFLFDFKRNSRIPKNSRYNSSLRILKFSRNSKIPYRDPPNGLGDDRKRYPQKGNSRIPSNSR